jgi:NAD(P)H dehydrogenase (quinone)
MGQPGAALDFAFGLPSAGWHGDVNGRVPLLHHKRP